VQQLAFKHELLHFFGRGGHVSVALAEGHHLEAISGQLGRQMGGVPAVQGDLRDVKPLGQFDTGKF
jgi:hypothetical protein